MKLPRDPKLQALLLQSFHHLQFKRTILHLQPVKMDQQIKKQFHQTEAGQQIDRNQQGVTGQQSTNATAQYQLNSIYDTKRADDIKDVLPEYQKNRNDAKTIQTKLDGGVRYGGVEDRPAKDQQIKSNKEPAERNMDINARQSKAEVNKPGIKMPPNGAGECKVLRKEPLVSRRKKRAMGVARLMNGIAR